MKLTEEQKTIIRSITCSHGKRAGQLYKSRPDCFDGARGAWHALSGAMLDQHAYNKLNRQGKEMFNSLKEYKIGFGGNIKKLGL